MLRYIPNSSVQGEFNEKKKSICLRFQYYLTITTGRSSQTKKINSCFYNLETTLANIFAKNVTNICSNLLFMKHKTQAHLRLENNKFKFTSNVDGSESIK